MLVVLRHLVEMCAQAVGLARRPLRELLLLLLLLLLLSELLLRHASGKLLLLLHRRLLGLWRCLLATSGRIPL